MAAGSARLVHRGGTASARLLRSGGTAARDTLVTTVGGPERTRVVIVLACVLALASADTATVGAAAIELRRALRISNTDIGVLVSVTSLVAAVFSLPFGMLADRVRRTGLLGLTLLIWGAAMLWSAAASSFGDLLLARLLLGAITAAAGPVTASLTGDWFPAAERGKIYGYILTGELLGAGAGFAFTGDIAALSWRASFIILALPAFVLAWLVFRLPEPVRGGQGALAAEPRPPDDRASRYRTAAPPPEPVQPQDIAAAMGIEPDQRLAAQAGRPMTVLGTVRYILSVRTNVALIVSGACGYYFMAGIQTFGTEFVSGQYGISQVLSNLLLLVIGVGAVIGVIASGPISDMLLRRGHLTARITVPAVTAALTVLLFIPALITHNVLAALPYVVVAAAALSAQNPPIDAARLDIMPSWLWGRSEGVRTLLRTAAQSLAPLLFGAVADYVFGGGTSGLKWAFVVMLAPLTASALYLFRARRLYPKDVATAAEAEAQHALSTDVLSGQGQDHRDDPQDPVVTPSTAHRKHQNPQQPNAPWRLPQSPNLSPGRRWGAIRRRQTAQGMGLAPGTTRAWPAETFSVSPSTVNSNEPTSGIQTWSLSMTCTGDVLPSASETFQVATWSLPWLGAARPYMTAVVVLMVRSWAGHDSVESADDLVGFELTYLLGMAFQLLLGEFVRRLDELGYEEVKPVHGMAFQVLKNGGATGTELASRLGITKQAVSVMVAQLEEMGYVERVDHPSGGRRHLIRLTEKATVHLDVAGRVLHDLEAELTGRIGSMPVRILRMELAEMVWALSQGEIPPLRPVW